MYALLPMLQLIHVHTNFKLHLLMIVPNGLFQNIGQFILNRVNRLLSRSQTLNLAAPQDDFQ